jgi:putative membrane protein
MKIIMAPSVAVVCGSWAWPLAVTGGWFTRAGSMPSCCWSWRSPPITAGSLLSRALARGERASPAKQLRLLNEVPGVLGAIIVILVIIKPFW